jgi:hypothetical protein
LVGRVGVVGETYPSPINLSVPVKLKLTCKKARARGGCRGRGDFTDFTVFTDGLLGLKAANIGHVFNAFIVAGAGNPYELSFFAIAENAGHWLALPDIDILVIAILGAHVSPNEISFLV